MNKLKNLNGCSLSGCSAIFLFEIKNFINENWNYWSWSYG